MTDERQESNGEQTQAGVYAQAQQEYGEQYKGMGLIELAREMVKAKEAVEKLAERKTKAQAAWDLLRFKLIPDAMAAANQQTVIFSGIGRVSLTADLQVSTKVGMKDKLYAWLKKNRLGDLIQPGVNPSTLKAFVKDRMRAGKEVPGDFLNVTPITRASITKV